MALVGLLGVVIERVAYRRMRNAPRLSVLTNCACRCDDPQWQRLAITGGRHEAFNTDLGYDGIDIGNVTGHLHPNGAGCHRALRSSCSLLQLFITRTMYGKAMRAVAIDPNARQPADGAPDVDRVIMLTFFIGSCPGCRRRRFRRRLLWQPSLLHAAPPVMGLKAFTAAVIGGIGSVPGAVLGGLRARPARGFRLLAAVRQLRLGGT